MSLDSETLATLQKAALKGLTLESTGLEVTDEIRETFETLKDQYANAPDGSMAIIVEDLEWGKWDEFERNNERFYGPLFGDKTFDELAAERKAEVLKRQQAQKEND